MGVFHGFIQCLFFENILAGTFATGFSLKAEIYNKQADE
jgi:hypothetical protein